MGEWRGIQLQTACTYCWETSSTEKTGGEPDSRRNVHNVRKPDGWWQGEIGWRVSNLSLYTKNLHSHLKPSDFRKIKVNFLFSNKSRFQSLGCALGNFLESSLPGAMSDPTDPPKQIPLDGRDG